jgi:hypothetical protein
MTSCLSRHTYRNTVMAVLGTAISLIPSREDSRVKRENDVLIWQGAV